MCADAWDSGDLSAVTYGIAGEMERAARSPIPHLLVGEGSIRPEPLEADLSERHAQMVTLSCSSLATAASAGPFHRNAQLLSYRDWQSYTAADIPVESRGQQKEEKKDSGVIQKVDQWVEGSTQERYLKPQHVCYESRAVVSCLTPDSWRFRRRGSEWILRWLEGEAGEGYGAALRKARKVCHWFGHSPFMPATSHRWLSLTGGRHISSKPYFFEPAHFRKRSQKKNLFTRSRIKKKSRLHEYAGKHWKRCSTYV